MGNASEGTATEVSSHEQPALVAEIMASNARLRVLAEVSHTFAMVATEYRSLIEKIARTTADLVGDGCIVTLVNADGETLSNAACAHRDAALQSDYETYLAGVELSKTTSASVAATVIRTGEPKLVAEVDPAALVARTDESLKPLVARLNVHSFVVVPIRARQTVIGSLSLMRNGPGRSYKSEELTLLQDLADRAGLAIENARLYDDLERRVSQRTAELESVNKELETFSYSVAHDLRAPLRAIDGFSKILLDEYGPKLERDAGHYLARVRAATERMTQIIDGLLNLSQVSRGAVRRAPVNVTDLAQTILADLRAQHADRNVDIVVAPDLATCADPRLVAVILENLLGNAWKFTMKRAAARIEVGQLERDEQKVLFVKDNGAGFDLEHADGLFGPFQRQHSEAEFQGCGIGLATVQRIIARHGGRVWAEAAVDHGATFFFTLGSTI